MGRPKRGETKAGVNAGEIMTVEEAAEFYTAIRPLFTACSRPGRSLLSNWAPTGGLAGMRWIGGLSQGR